MSWIWMTIILSTFLIYEKFNIVEGKKGFKFGEQDWGHIEIRSGAYIFWWLYYANPPEKSPYFSPYQKPLLIWLQGGPGAPSTAYGNFEEIGPLDVNLEKRNYTWVNDYNVLFIDNPVGTGFSYVDDDSKLATNNQNIAFDLLRFIKIFMETIPPFKKIPTYILSESYGGKMAIYFALYWDILQKRKMIESNLRGVALGDAFISPEDTVISYAPHLFYSGMVNYNCYESIQHAADLTKNEIDSKKWIEARLQFMKTWQIIRECTNGISFYNILEKNTPLHRTNYQYYSYSRELLEESDFNKKLTDLMNNEVKKALGLNISLNLHSKKVKEHLSEDFMKPEINIVEQILNETNLKVFIYNGQLDVIIPTSSTFNWVQKLKWSGAENWKNSKRSALIIDNSNEGYIQAYKNLNLFWINRAGHMVPKDNYYAMKIILQMLTSTT